MIATAASAGSDLVADGTREEEVEGFTDRGLAGSPA
jgi:hypothetical protein